MPLNGAPAERHTAENVSSHLLKVLEKYSATAKLTGIVADGASSQRRALQLTVGESHNKRVWGLWCAAHRTHLAVLDAFKEVRSLLTPLSFALY